MWWLTLIVNITRFRITYKHIYDGFFHSGLILVVNGYNIQPLWKHLTIFSWNICLPYNLIVIGYPFVSINLDMHAVYMHASGGQRSTSSSIAPRLLFLRHGLSSNLEPINTIRLAIKPQDSSCFCFPSEKIRDTSHLAFAQSTGNLNTGPHAYMANTYPLRLLSAVR